MNIERALATDGFMYTDELEYLAQAASKSFRIVEVGSWLGRSACAIAANTPGILFCVDWWHWDHRSDLYTGFRKNTEGLPIIPIHLSSVQAAGYFSRLGLTFDMIFIDAEHNEPNISEDLTVWGPLLAPGGIFCGHDYDEPLWPHVKPAVDRIVGPIRQINHIWTIEL